MVKSRPQIFDRSPDRTSSENPSNASKNTTKATKYATRVSAPVIDSMLSRQSYATYKSYSGSNDTTKYHILRTKLAATFYEF